MENSPALNKRRSLTLSSRLLQKRHSASPQSCSRAGTDAKDADAPGSPLMRLNTASNLDYTPPGKKSSYLDDSVDFSPRNSLSPSCLFSQTLVNGSPEVSWRWNRENKKRGDKVNTTTDSGFDSGEFGAQKKERHQRVQADELRRKQFDNRQWRAQQMRDHELLKERCDKLHRQLDEQADTQPASTAKADAALADFLNDSDTDCFLVEASQQLESKIAHKPSVKAAPVVTTPTSHHKAQTDKRSSFYMKFLEDESESEDWLAALDEVMVEATQPKKPRMSLQRYKSMPTANDAQVSSEVINNNTKQSSTASTAAETPRIKRHASSHALSPAAATSARGKLFGRRK
ncbi:uncharacterized protein LOC108602338 isoform X2 [Drosophila busckii]|uniref:uncharacterized protein LOC108602338 isoform X2 n=1 Tax=Drosophila busckii TaxID=30019 RepID=UPI00083E97E8|nr:uncharacterized protein LOC108602338 isoform X2 [Drosophila busckii]